jgi:septal ring factor EnvC (AmiA/AmiB activator)
MQPDPSYPQATQVISPAAVAPKAPMKINFLALFLALALVILCCAFTGLGYWAFTLNTKLNAKQGELVTLQGKYDSLTAEKNKLSTDLDTTTASLEQTKTELDATKTELSTTQSDLSTSKNETAALQAKIDKANKVVDVLVAIFVNSENDASIEKKVVATGDTKMKSLFDDFMAKPNQTTFNAFEDYLYEALADILN